MNRFLVAGWGDVWPRTTPECCILQRKGGTQPYCTADVAGILLICFFLYSPTSFAVQSLCPQGSVGRKNVLMSPISSARESLCMEFWGTSTCLPAWSQCAEAGGSLNRPSRRLPAPTHADGPISFSSRMQREGRNFKAINVENIYGAFCLREQSSELPE